VIVPPSDCTIFVRFRYVQCLPNTKRVSHRKSARKREKERLCVRAYLVAAVCGVIIARAEILPILAQPLWRTPPCEINPVRLTPAINKGCTRSIRISHSM
jgi:hypothetical protein